MIGVALSGLPSTILVIQIEFAVVHHAQREIGEIDDDIALAEIVRHPAPALQVGEDDVDRLVRLLAVHRFDGLRRQQTCDLQLVLLLILLDRIGERLVVSAAAVARHIEPCTQFWHPLILRADLRRRACRDLRLRWVGFASAVFRELGLQGLVLRHLRFIGIQNQRDIFGLDHRGEHVGRLGSLGLVGNVRANARPMDFGLQKHDARK